jgi:hypothetical protein
MFAAAWNRRNAERTHNLCVVNCTTPAQVCAGVSSLDTTTPALACEAQAARPAFDNCHIFKSD